MDVAGLCSLTTDGYIGFSPDKPTIKIDLYGDSISCGYGNLDGANMNSDNTNALLTYSYLAAEELNAQINIQAASGWGLAWGNEAAGYGNASWADHYKKTTFSYTEEWNFRNYQADIIIISLGTNDNGAMYNSAQFQAKYKAMIEELKELNPNAKFVLYYGMMSLKSTVWADVQAVANCYDYVVAHQATVAGNLANGHPSVASNLANAPLLAATIKDLLGIK